jgi:Holliday junction resolvasome RuvABC endonuclease subunit
MSIIGIDPGLSGGVAIIRAPTDVTCIVMPVSGGEVDAGLLAAWLLRELPRPLSGTVAYVEKVGSMPKQGVASTFKFGKGYGQVLGMLAALGIDTRLVTPQAWKKQVLAGTTQDKDAAIAYCRMRWPGIELVQHRCRKPHDGLADALCIAAYGAARP